MGNGGSPCLPERVVELFERRDHVVDVQGVRSVRLGQGQVEKKAQFDQPVDGKDLDDLLGETVQHRAAAKHAPEDQQLRVILCKEYGVVGIAPRRQSP